MIELKLAIMVICGFLNSWGGYSFHNARRYFMPLVLAISVSYVTHILWLGLVIIPVIGTLILGYKRFGSGNFSRAMWLFLQFSVCGIGLLLTGHLNWYFYIPYCILGGALGGTLVNVYQPIGDFIEGLFLGSIVILIF